MEPPRIGIWKADELLVYILEAAADVVTFGSDGPDLVEGAAEAQPDVLVVGEAGADVASAVNTVTTLSPATRIVVLDSLDQGVPSAAFVGADAILGRTMRPLRLVHEISSLLVSAMKATGAALPSEPGSAATARRLVRHATSAWGAGEVEDTVALLATELVANAVRHGGDDIDIVIRVADECVRVEVRDSSDIAPTKQDPSVDGESGRGVALVEALSDAWGCDPTRDGKSVWFELRRPSR